MVYLLHWLVEEIHRRRLRGNTRIPSVEVDAITEGMALSVIDGIETGVGWWVDEPALSHSCLTDTTASTTSETVRSSRAFAESKRLQGLDRS